MRKFYPFRQNKIIVVRHRQKEPIKQTHTLKIKDYTTFIISILAFALSISNFYFVYFRVNHSLKVSASADLSDWGSSDGLLIVKGVLLNDGNKTEILYSGQLTIGTEGNYLLLSKIGPYVLKAGEAISFSMTDSITHAVELVGKWNASQDSLFLDANIQFASVSSKGTDFNLNYNLGTFCYYEPSDNFSFNRDTTTQVKWMKLVQ